MASGLALLLARTIRARVNRKCLPNGWKNYLRSFSRGTRTSPQCDADGHRHADKAAMPLGITCLDRRLQSTDPRERRTGCT
jgi:hypothetical protein